MLLISHAKFPIGAHLKLIARRRLMVAEEQRLVRPTPERARHGSVEIAHRPIISRPGEFDAPAVAVDLLTSMERRGVIDSDERLAGERFRTWFRLAALDSLRAADISKPRVDDGQAGSRKDTASSNNAPPDALARLLIEVPRHTTEAFVRFGFIRSDQRNDLAAIVGGLRILGQMPMVSRIS